jgi:hypothetical protein
MKCRRLSLVHTKKKNYSNNNNTTTTTTMRKGMTLRNEGYVIDIDPLGPIWIIIYSNVLKIGRG